MRKVQHSLNYCLPGLCPFRDTDRIWDDGAEDSEKTRADCVSYVLKEHSFFGIFYAPTSRHTDLGRIQLFLLFGLNLITALYLSMWIADRRPEWLHGIEWGMTLLMINSGAAVAKVLYRSGLKRTYFCRLRISDIRVSDPPSVARGARSSLSILLKLGASERELALAWNEADKCWRCDGADEEIVMALRYEQLRFALVKRREGGVVLTRTIERVIGLAKQDLTHFDSELGSRVHCRATLEWEALSVTKKLRHFVQAPLVGHMESGCISWKMLAERDEPITLQDLLMAAVKPIFECVVVKLALYIIIGPAYLMVMCKRRCCRGLRAIRQAATGEVSRKRVQREPWPPPLTGAQWRICMRLFVFAWIGGVTVCYILRIFEVGDTIEQVNVEAAIELFLQVKLFGWLVTEPGALMWTYLTLRSCCPSFLPEQCSESTSTRSQAMLVNPLLRPSQKSMV